MFPFVSYCLIMPIYRSAETCSLIFFNLINIRRLMIGDTLLTFVYLYHKWYITLKNILKEDSALCS